MAQIIKKVNVYYFIILYGDGTRLEVYSFADDQIWCLDSHFGGNDIRKSMVT